MKGKAFFKVDFLHGPIVKSLVLFAIPMLISSLFQQLYNMVDTMIIGHYLGDDSLAWYGYIKDHNRLESDFLPHWGNQWPGILHQFKHGTRISHGRSEVCRFCMPALRCVSQL